MKKQTQMPRPLPLGETRCTGKSCAIANKCARHTDIPAHANVLAWFAFHPAEIFPECPYFVDNGAGEKAGGV